MHAFIYSLSSQNYMAKLGAIYVNVFFLVMEENFCRYLKKFLSTVVAPFTIGLCGRSMKNVVMLKENGA